MPTAREVIETIQRDRGFDPAGVAAPPPRGRNQRDLGNALKLLSDQLYNSDGHFLLELLQNADDNSYASGVEPAVTLTLGPSALELHNNERGFTDAHVEALCSVGESTKRAQKSEATGEKGIGFKAVFKVSDRPEIHSGDFHFCFDRTRYGDLGLVTPSWIGLRDGMAVRDGTSIVLPYKTSYKSTADLPAQLRPELLLFLRRLRRIRLVDVASASTVELHRRGEGSMVEVVRSATGRNGSSTTTHRFFRQSRDVSVGDLGEELRPGISTVPVVVALALNEDLTVDGVTPRHLFAFLPIRESGLRFVAHADFILNTSREDVMRQQPWNIRLRDELGLALAEAVMALRETSPSGRTGLRVLCKPGAVTDPFLQPILVGAINTLKARPCVPVTDNGWATPDKALRRDVSSLSELIPSPDAENVLGKSLVDEKVSLIAEGLDLLKVPSFQLADLLRAASNSAWVTQRPAAWFADLYRRLEPITRSEESLKLLRAAPLIRCGDGSLVPSTNRGVFRSLSRRVTYGFENRLAILDAAVLNEAKSRGWLEGVDACLSRLGVRDADPVSIIDKHIVRTHAESSDNFDVETLVGHGRYLRDHIDQYLHNKGDDKDKALSTLRETVWLLSSKTAGGKRILNHAQGLYLGDAYGDPNRVQALFAGAIDAMVVARDYLESDSTRNERAWAHLLTMLGAHVLPRVEACASIPSHVPTPPHYRGSPPPSAADWRPSPELSSLIDSTDAERKMALVALLDAHWSGYWSRFTGCRVSRGYQQSDGASTFLEAIRAMNAPDGKDEWGALAGQYQPTENNRTVFGNGVRYLKKALMNPALVAALGVVAEPSVEQVLDRLDELSAQQQADKKSVGKLYGFLSDHWEGHEEQIAAFLAENAVVCVKLGDNPCWASSGACCWQVPARLREAAPLPGLVSVWPQLEEFFIEKLEVRRSLSREEWVATLRKLPELELEISEAGDLARQVYRELNGHLEREELPADGAPPEWLEPAINDATLWTTKGEWWPNDSNVFSMDDPGLAELFDGSDTVAFVDITPSELPRFSVFLRAMNVLPVSSASRTPVKDREGRNASDIAAHLTGRWPAIARLLYHRHNEQYRAAKASGHLRRLRELSVSVWSPLLLEVTLADERRQRGFECKISDAPDSLDLFMDESEQDNWAAVGLEMGQFLGLDESASSMIAMLLSAKDEAAVEKLLRTHRIHDLPESEWTELIHGAVPDRNTGSDDDPGEPRESDETVDESDTADEADKTESEDAEGEGVLPGPGGAGGSKDRVAPSGGGGGIPAATQGAAGQDQVNESRVQEPPTRTGASGDGESARGTAPTVVRPGGSHGSFGGSRSDGTAPPTTPDSGNRGERKQQRSPGRLISYVTPPDQPDSEPDGDGEAQAERDRTNQAAIAYVVLKEKEEGRRPEVRDHTNPGYDIESFTDAGESDRYIEVKGLKGVWGERGVTMTPTQFAFASEHRDRAWLYVVEFADEPARRKLWRVRDPAAKVTRYGFDHGWQGVADLAPPAQPPGAALKAGARWRCDDGTIGVIESVKRSSSFVSIRVIKPDGGVVSRSGPEGMLLRNIVEA